MSDQRITSQADGNTYRMDQPVTLACGCATTWHDPVDLFVGIYAYCPEHGDTTVREVA